MDISTQTLPLEWSLLKSPLLSLCPDPLVITVLGATACLPSYPHSEKLSGQGWDRAFHDVVLVLAQCLARSSCPPSECGRETLLSTYWVRRLHFCAHTYQGAEHLRMGSFLGLPWRPRGWDSTLPLQGEQVWSLVSGLECHMLHGTAKKVKKKEEMGSLSWIDLNPVEWH